MILDQIIVHAWNLLHERVSKLSLQRSLGRVGIQLSKVAEFPYR